MFGIPLFQKKKVQSEGFVFLLFLSGEKMFGIALDENNPDHQSDLYMKHIDPFLKNAALKLDELLSNCERDLGKNILLKHTVLFLNSIYVTDSGAIREDYLKNIKKLINDMELSNEGYVNFYEAIAHEYGTTLDQYYLLEESLYDYVLYEFNKQKLVKTSKVAKIQNQKINAAELAAACPPEAQVFTYYLNPMATPIFAHEKTISEKELGNLFIGLYLKNATAQTAPAETLPVVRGATPRTAPGFVIEDVGDIDDKKPTPVVSMVETIIDEPEQEFDENTESEELPSEKKKFVMSAFLGNIARLVKIKFVMFAAVFLLVILFALYVIQVHSADVYLTTQKENFSTKTTFLVGGSKNIGKSFSAPFSVSISSATTGQKNVGDVAKGDVTIYSGLFEQKTIAAGVVFKTSNNVSFTLASSVVVPAATTSGSLDSGGVITKPGKVTVSIAASLIGPEGNIAQGDKLYTSQFKDTDLYAVVVKDFAGGYRRKVRVFSQADATALEKKALAQVQSEMKSAVVKEKSAEVVLFPDTYTTTNLEKKFSEKIDTETDNVSLKYSGDGSILYAQKTDLEKKIQTDSLKDKEFVQGTFSITNLKLTSTKNDIFTYTATVLGKVQRYIDQPHIAQVISGKLSGNATKLITAEQNIEKARIVTKPLPLPFVPWNTARIRFLFENN